MLYSNLTVSFICLDCYSISSKESYYAIRCSSYIEPLSIAYESVESGGNMYRYEYNQLQIVTVLFKSQ
jgi:hypothetical protein